MQLRWSHAVIYVRDLDAMVDFYRDVLGFEVADRGPLQADAPEIVFLSQVATDHHQLGMVAARKGDAPSNSVDHFAFRVDSLDDVREMKARLEADGRCAAPPAPVTHGNAWSIYFKDPEGNGIEIFCDSPWHVQQPAFRPWDPTQSNEKVVTDTKREFQDTPEFGSMQEYRLRKAEEFAGRR